MESDLDIKIITPLKDVSMRSPSFEKRRLEYKTKEKEFENETYLKTCCSGTSDKRFLTYISQMSFGIIISTFCMVQLVRVPRENNEIYVSMLSGIIGVFLNKSVELIKS